MHRLQVRVPELPRQRPGPLNRVLGRRKIQAQRRALQNPALEKALCVWVLGESRDRERTAGLARQGNTARIPAERRRIGGDPPQGRHLVSEPDVRITNTRQEAQRTQPVVDRDPHDIAIASESVSSVERQVPGTSQEPAAVNPDQHRAAKVVDTRCPHIERQAILIEGRLPMSRPAAILPAARAGAPKARNAPRRARRPSPDAAEQPSSERGLQVRRRRAHRGRRTAHPRHTRARCPRLCS